MIHAFVAMHTYGETLRKALTRRCPHCKHEQVTSEGKLFEPVTCERCARAIPPKHAPKQSGGRGYERLTAKRGGK